MAAVTVRPIRDLTVVVVVLAETHAATLLCSLASTRAPVVGVEYPLPDFSLIETNGPSTFFHEHLKSIQISLLGCVHPE